MFCSHTSWPFTIFPSNLPLLKVKLDMVENHKSICLPFVHSAAYNNDQAYSSFELGLKGFARPTWGSNPRP